MSAPAIKSMERLLRRRLLALGLCGVLLSAIACTAIFHRVYSQQVWRSMAHEAQAVAVGYYHLESDFDLNEFSLSGLRVTLIAPDGTVLVETAAEGPAENHLSRPEVQQALQEGVGISERASATMGYQTYYYALRMEDGRVLRLAQDERSIWFVYNQALPVILASCLALSLAGAALAGLFTKSLVQPVARMAENLDTIREHVPYREFLPFADAIHSDRMLRETNERMRQEFTANVSHELKTPLTSISGYAELIEAGIAKPQDISQFAGKIRVEAQRMLALVNDILQLSHLDTLDGSAGQKALDEKINLRDVVHDCAERQKLNARKAYVTLAEQAADVWVMGSRSLLDELCQNLCDNAVRYNRPGGKVQLLARRTADGHAQLVVRDTGIGIPKQAQSRVFERFYRVDKSRSKATGGTGLGLAIVKHIVRVHNASIQLESEPGVGTTVTVTFATAP